MALFFIAIFLLLVYRFSTIVAYVIIALILAYLFDPIVNRMQVAGINRTLSVSSVVVSFILAIVWISTTIGPTIGNQIVSLASAINIEAATGIATQIEEQIQLYLPFVGEGQIRSMLTQFIDRLFDIGGIQGTVTGLVGVFANIFTAALIIPFATFFFLKDGSKLRRQVLQVVPNKYFETTLTILNKIETRLIMYFRGVLIQCTIVGVISWLGLSAIGLNNALSVATAVGLANTIPYFGPIIGYILSIIVGVFETGDFAIVPYCIGAILVAQLVDNIILQPLIFSRSADIHPLYILFIILLGSELAGFIGMLLAIPIATIVRIIITEINWSLNNYQVFKLDR